VGGGGRYSCVCTHRWYSCVCTRRCVYTQAVQLCVYTHMGPGTGKTIIIGCEMWNPEITHFILSFPTNNWYICVQYRPTTARRMRTQNNFYFLWNSGSKFAAGADNIARPDHRNLKFGLRHDIKPCIKLIELYFMTKSEF
jgi:hypothetical protein